MYLKIALTNKYDQELVKNQITKRLFFISNDRSDQMFMEPRELLVYFILFLFL